MIKKVILKKGKEKSIIQRHPWIFSGAIEKLPSVEPGEIAQVVSHDQKILGYGYFHPKLSLSGRMVSFGEEDYQTALKNSLNQAVNLRKKFFVNQETNAYRIVNAEADQLPGLIVDRYNDFLVVQINTQGMERLKFLIIEELASLLKCKGIFEKSISSIRLEEGLKSSEGILWGEDFKDIEIKESGLKFLVDPKKGQKSGFFLDQREMRKWVKELSHNKSVLNCFSYTGGFSIYASSGGASRVDSVDISKSALDLAMKNFSLNGFSSDLNHFFCQDVFDFLKNQTLDHELVILDPPAFAKKKHDVIAACRGYKELNRIAMQKMGTGTLLLTCSCSFHVNEALFQKVLFQAALDAKRSVKIIGKHRLGIDHPINIYHPEMDYLKSFLLYLE